MSVVFIDTQIMIWALLGQSKKDQQFMIPRAKYLIDDLEKNKHEVYISSVTLSEMQCGLEKKYHDKVRNTIQRMMRVAPFDSLGAKYYARIWIETRKDGLYSDLADMGIIRREFKADCMILGTALAYKANKLYTHDKCLKRISAQYLNVPDMPKVPPKSIPLPLDNLYGDIGQKSSA